VTAGRVAGKVAVLTGGASGLGFACAERFAREGASVACVDVDRDGVEAAAARIRDQGGRALGLVADVTDASALDAMAADVVTAFGGIDVLVANAGVYDEGSIHEITPAAWQRVIDVDLTGVMLSVRSVLEPMRERGGGAIVAQASVAGLAGVPRTPAYAAAKGGVIALVRQLAVDYASWGIRVNAICPGTIPTAMTADALAQRGAGAGARYVPLGRMGEPQDVAALAAFLAGDEAGWITGAVYTVDGGTTAALLPRHLAP
jgi:NAD(P)-dependent dehydrogenase (short-subunit alcohol dehydrogenase family)